MAGSLDEDDSVAATLTALLSPRNKELMCRLIPGGEAVREQDETADKRLNQCQTCPAVTPPVNHCSLRGASANAGSREQVIETQRAKQMCALAELKSL